MRKRMNYLRCLSLALPCMLLAVGCENGVSSEMENNEPVELQVAPMVALTRSAITGGEQNQSGTGYMQNISVYATGADYTADKNNNHAVYTQNSGKWTSTADGKIYLTNQAATVYAYYPAYTVNADGTPGSTAVGINESSFTSASTISISTLASGTIASTNNADKAWSGTAWTDNNQKNSIVAALGETDYMWAAKVDGVTNKANNQLALTMSHALSMVSFRIYNDGTYHNTGALGKIELKDVSTPVLYSGAKMKIADGTISDASTTATYTRIITGYTLAKQGVNNVAAGGEAAASPKLSIMVLPVASYTTKTVQATFTVDGAPYSVALTAPTGNKWEAGKNYLYTVKLSGTALSITTVTVTAWEEKAVDGDLTIN